jgi:hypothetical protein
VTHQNGLQTVWIVTKVERGIPVEVEAFYDRRPAQMRMWSWRRRMHPEYDEIALFEVPVR